MRLAFRRSSLALCAASALVIALAGPAAADPLEARVTAACLKLYVHGVTEEIATREVGTRGVPVLLRLLKDPAFPRRDNVVAFLWQLGGAESTDALAETLVAPPAVVDTPVESRALRLVPEALGKIAARGDRKALDELLAMTDPAGDGGRLADLALSGKVPAAYAKTLLGRAYHGLALSGTPEGRGRLATIAGGRASGDPQQAREAASALQAADEGAGAPASSGTDGAPALTSRTVLPLTDGQTSVHDTPISYANHVDANFPISDDRVDALMTAATAFMGQGDATDVACCVGFTRSGSGGTVGTPGDGLDVIDSQAEFDAIATAPGGRLKVVNGIGWCGGFIPNVIGCAYLPGNGGAVVRWGDVATEASLWLHEYGHNTGLGHNANGCYVMTGTISACNVRVTQTECDAYHFPWGGGTVAVGSCVDGDADDVHDLADNCTAVANNNQADADLDGVGDVCDAPCGNGAVEATEECDDANLVPDDGCTNQCRLCGNGIEAAPEECDDANVVATDGCTNACTTCGNGLVTAPEECDDGNLLNLDGCGADCTYQYCGNTTVETGEECDDGGGNPYDGCTWWCTVCGNGVTTAPEQCDDGNLDPDDGCTATCLSCGNGVTTYPEHCDDGNFLDGDGCSRSCRLEFCGSGELNAGEECDDGNGDQTDGCRNDCTICGNGVTAGTEQCDDGNAVPDDGCTTACTTCGNGVVTSPEQCDDGNLIDEDGCSPACQVTTANPCVNPYVIPPQGGTFYPTTSDSSTTLGGCGGFGPERGFVWTPAITGTATISTCGSSFNTVLYVRQATCVSGPEVACNDQFCGNQSQVSLTVQAGIPYYIIVDGYAPSSAGSGVLTVTPPTGCGDAITNGSEECDDGNADPADGCTNDCTLCGNGVTTAPEECDDGNLIPGDGCSGACTMTPVGCGNGVTGGGEECDDANADPADGCTNDCTLCGNGVTTAPEQCDDGNLVSGDGCSAACEPDGHPCGAPTVIPPTGGVFNGTTAGTSELQGLCAGHFGPEKVYAWTPMAAGIATISTCGSSFDTYVYLREASCTSGAVSGCSDDFCGLQSVSNPFVQAGVTYYIVVDGFGPSDAGSFTLTVTPPAFCGDGVTTGSEECDDGNTNPDDGCTNDCTVCGNGTITPPEICDDGNLANGDGCPSSCDVECPATPLAGCRLPTLPGKASLHIKNYGYSSKNQIKWKWGNGTATTKGDYGDPVATDSYVLCLYEGTSPVMQARIPAGGLCLGKPCWADKPTAFAYKDKGITPDGIEKLDLKAGVTGKAKIGLQGKGVSLPVPNPAALASPVRAQLIRPNGPCWEAVFSPPFGKQDAVQFKDKSD